MIKSKAIYCRKSSQAKPVILIITVVRNIDPPSMSTSHCKPYFTNRVSSTHRCTGGGDLPRVSTPHGKPIAGQTKPADHRWHIIFLMLWYICKHRWIRVGGICLFQFKSFQQGQSWIFLTFFQTVWVDREADSSKKETAEKINRFKNFFIPFSLCLFLFPKQLVSLQEGR